MNTLTFADQAIMTACGETPEVGARCCGESLDGSPGDWTGTGAPTTWEPTIYLSPQRSSAMADRDGIDQRELHRIGGVNFNGLFAVFSAKGIDFYANILTLFYQDEK